MMRIILMTLITVMPLACSASKEWINSSTVWMKDALPENLTFSFDKAKIQFKGYKQQRFALSAVQEFTDTVSLETELLMQKARYEGINGQRERDFSALLMPRYRLNAYMSVGIGIKYESAPMLQLPGRERQRLGAARSFVVSTKLNSLTQRHWIQLDLANYSRDSFDVSGFYDSNIKAFTENTVSLSYQGQF